jgi:hypothetical protein
MNRKYETGYLLNLASHQIRDVIVVTVSTRRGEYGCIWKVRVRCAYGTI